MLPAFAAAIGAIAITESARAFNNSSGSSESAPQTSTGDNSGPLSTLSDEELEAREEEVRAELEHLSGETHPMYDELNAELSEIQAEQLRREDTGKSGRPKLNFDFMADEDESDRRSDDPEIAEMKRSPKNVGPGEGAIGSQKSGKSKKGSKSSASKPGGEGGKPTGKGKPGQNGVKG